MGCSYFCLAKTMNMRNVLTAIIVIVALHAGAQDSTVQSLKTEANREIKHDAADTIPMVWRKGGIISVNLSQGSLSNWAAGGDNFSLSLNTLVTLYAFYKKDRITWSNTLDFNYGFIHTTSLGNRKNDDRLDLYSKYGYAIAPKWSIAALGNF